MKKINLLVFSIIWSSVLFSQNDQFNIKYADRPHEYEMYSAPDSLGNFYKLKIPVENRSKEEIKIPYPIIFIHGLAGKSDTWDSFSSFLDNRYEFNFGGRFDFCLNFDGDNKNANLDFYDSPGADIALFTPTLVLGEYYYVNFDVGINGSYHPNGNYYEVNSNQQAIYKQGKTLSFVIYKVLQITGAEKVVLMGHSMGGLAAREYLQKPDLWQADGKHHVAKLITTGTPHGGSNATSFGIGFGGVNEKLDATRDLRRSYAISGEPGVYLFGGLESNLVMWNNLFFDYKNIDVNCNGNKGELITGINQKNIPTNLTYSCIIGICDNCILGGNQGDNDGIVKAYCADLKNYYNSLKVDRFYYYGNSNTEIHTFLPKVNSQNMYALDEPGEYNLAYKIKFNNTYTGFITTQGDGEPEFDKDVYLFSVDNPSSIKVSVQDIEINNFLISIKDMNGVTQAEKTIENGSETIEMICQLSEGNYYLEVFGVPTGFSYLNAFHFSLTNITSTYEYRNSDIFSVYPIPARDFITIKNMSDHNEIVIACITSLSGQELIKKEFKNQVTIPTDHFIDGLYLLRIQHENGVEFKKIFISK